MPDDGSNARRRRALRTPALVAGMLLVVLVAPAAQAATSMRVHVVERNTGHSSFTAPRTTIAAAIGNDRTVALWTWPAVGTRCAHRPLCPLGVRLRSSNGRYGLRVIVSTRARRAAPQTAMLGDGRAFALWYDVGARRWRGSVVTMDGLEGPTITFPGVTRMIDSPNREKHALVTTTVEDGQDVATWTYIGPDGTLGVKFPIPAEDPTGMHLAAVSIDNMFNIAVVYDDDPHAGSQIGAISSSTSAAHQATTAPWQVGFYRPDGSLRRPFVTLPATARLLPLVASRGGAFIAGEHWFAPASSDTRIVSYENGRTYLPISLKGAHLVELRWKGRGPIEARTFDNHAPTSSWATLRVLRAVDAASVTWAVGGGGAIATWTPTRRVVDASLVPVVGRVTAPFVLDRAEAGTSRVSVRLATVNGRGDAAVLVLHR